PMGYVTDQEFDGFGRLKTVRLPKTWVHTAEDFIQINPVLKYEYDAMGNRTVETDARGNSVRYEYDLLGREIKNITEVTNPFTGEKELIITKHYYDLVGNRIKTVDPNNREWRYTYSARGYLLSEEDPLGRKVRYRYDPMGNRIAIIDPRNKEEN